MIDNEPVENLVSYVEKFMDASTEADVIINYSFVEYHLLEYLGIGLDLTECAATGKKDNLEFISPKSVGPISRPIQPSGIS